MQRGTQGFADWLRDGVVLCALANAVRPGVVPHVNQASPPAPQGATPTHNQILRTLAG